jgi:hypothetical protein
MSGGSELEPNDLLNYYYLRPEPMYDKKKGEVFGLDVNLVKDAVPTYIDFVYSKNNIGVGWIRSSGPLYKLIIYNIGPGLVYFSVNMTQIEGGTSALPAGSEPRTFGVNDRPLIQKVNLRAVGADAIVNLTMEI